MIICPYLHTNQTLLAVRKIECLCIIVGSIILRIPHNLSLKLNPTIDDHMCYYKYTVLQSFCTPTSLVKVIQFLARLPLKLEGSLNDLGIEITNVGNLDQTSIKAVFITWASGMYGKSHYGTLG